MVKIEWSKLANYNLLQIYNYIYQDSIYYAAKTVNKIIQITDNLDFSPYMGRKVFEYDDDDNIRELIYKSYRIIYEINLDRVVIRRIWHSARILPQYLIS